MISKRTVIKGICGHRCGCKYDECGYLDHCMFVNLIMSIQPSKTDKQIGHWYDVGSLSCRCSKCGCKNNWESRFCPNCGAEMEKINNEQ